MNVNPTPAQSSLPASTSKIRTLDDSERANYERAQAMAASTTESTTNSATSITKENPLLEIYAMPSWLSGFGVCLNSIIPTGDPKAEAFAAASASELRDYSERLQTHLLGAYEKNGLSDPTTRYNALKAVPGLNDRLYADFKSSVSSDSRMLSLMSKLGVTMS